MHPDNIRVIEPFDLVPEPAAPSLPGSVVVRPEAEDVLDAMAADLLIHAESCVRAFGDFHLAVSGHPGLDPVYTKLMIDPAYRWLPWSRTQLWIVDEHIDGGAITRFENIRSSIVQHAGIPVGQVHPLLPAAGNLAETARLYERELLETLGWREKGHDRIDCVVLHADEVAQDRGPTDGDGHDPPGRKNGATAPQANPRGAIALGKKSAASKSSPPNSPGGVAGQPGSAGLVAVYPCDASAPAACIGMTGRLLRASRFIAVFGSGDSSAAHVARFAEDRDATLERIGPVQGELRWYLDGQAVGFDPKQ